jgi:regulatory protein
MPSAERAIPDEKKVETAAVRLLARREHGTEELKRKLVAKGYDPAEVDKVVEKLRAKRLVSDERFVATFVHHHAKRGQGPIRIKAELRQQGIEDERIEPELASSDIDWRHFAAEVLRRKFGTKRPASLAARAKQMRFLQYRGFTADQIRAAMLDLASEDVGQTEIDDSSESFDPNGSD